MTTLLYDELILISDKFTEVSRKRRTDILNRALRAPQNLGPPESVESTKIILKLPLDNPNYIF